MDRRPEAAPQTTVDRMLAYRNLLCAEDHLKEVITSADPEERNELSGVLSVTRDIRRNIKFNEQDKRFHCIAKHLAVASEALDEVVSLATGEDYQLIEAFNAESLRGLSQWAFEKLLGKKIISCGRCGKELEDEPGRDQEEHRRDFDDDFGGRFSGDIIQTSSED